MSRSNVRSLAMLDALAKSVNATNDRMRETFMEGLGVGGSALYQLAGAGSCERGVTPVGSRQASFILGFDRFLQQPIAVGGGSGVDVEHQDLRYVVGMQSQQR